MRPVLDSLVKNQSLTVYQNGFLEGYGTSKHIFEAKRRIDNGEFVVSIDSENAFNSVCWDRIEEMLLDDEYHSDPKGNILFKDERIWINFLLKSQIVLKDDGTIFRPKQGVPQGYLSSPQVFILLLDWAIYIKDKRNKTRKSLYLNPLTYRQVWNQYCLAYADDVLLITPSRPLMGDVWRLVQEVLNFIKLKTNYEKTFTLDKEVAKECTIWDENAQKLVPIQFAKSLTYLGVELFKKTGINSIDVRNTNKYYKKVYDKLKYRVHRIRLNRSDEHRQNAIKSHL